MESDEPAQEVNGEGIPEATSTVTDAPEQTGGDQAAEDAVTETANEQQPTDVAGDAPITNSESTAEGGGQVISNPDEDHQSQPPLQDDSGEGNQENGQDQADNNGGDIDKQDSGQEEPASQPEPAADDSEPGKESNEPRLTAPAEAGNESDKPRQTAPTEAGKVSDEPKQTASTEAGNESDEPKQTGPTEQATEIPSEDTSVGAGGVSQSIDPKQSETSRPGTDQSTVSKNDKDKKDKKEKKKREKKRSRQASRDEVRKRTSNVEGGLASSNKSHLEIVLLSFFQTVDPDNSGHLDSVVFWEILQSTELNLQLTPEDITKLKGQIEKDDLGQISYSEFASKAAELISSLYQEQPASDQHWVELATNDRSIVVAYNKQTGEMRDQTKGDVDLFGGVIENMFQLADVENKGYINREEFTQMLQSEQMTTFLSDEDVLQMQQYFETIPEGKATYTEFYPLAKELILRVYRVKDPSESEWCQLNSPQVGVFWFNKFTGETQRGVETAGSDDRQQEIAFLKQAYAKVEAVNFELEQYKQENKELQNGLAQATEEQEALHSQLYETGHVLDEAHSEIEMKEKELEEARAIISSKEQEIEQFLAQRDEFERLRERLEVTENELKLTRETIAVRDKTVADRDTNITDLRRTSEAITDKLKTAHGQGDAKDSTITSLNHKLNFEKMQAQKYEKQVSELEERLAAIEQELSVTKQSLEDKTFALSQARKHLKNSRERTLDLEKDTERMSQTQEKLRSAECEIRTLKTFLTTKTAMIEKRKKELRETKTVVSELLEKDQRRAFILADVLEKTARQYQHQVGPTGSKRMQLEAVQTPMEIRPASAPAIPPEGEDVIDGLEEDTTHSPRIMKSFTLDKGVTSTSPYFGTRGTQPSPHKGPGKSKSLKARGRSRTVPKLPQINKMMTQQKHNTFVFSTTNDLRRQYWEDDQKVSDHVISNPNCTCELCRMNDSIVGPSALRPETGVTAQTGISGFQSDMDMREVTLAKQMHIGQRVVIRMKKSEYDLEPQQLTGIIKYIGKVDSEFIDNRIYVGVRLDEAVGDTDGLIKGKRYFTCPSKHGKLVRIASVMAVLPTKSVFYKPLQSISKRSPYGGAAPKKSSSSSIKVV